MLRYKLPAKLAQKPVTSRTQDSITRTSCRLKRCSGLSYLALASLLAWQSASASSYFYLTPEKPIKPIRPEITVHSSPFAKLRQKLSWHGFLSAGGSIGSTPAEYSIPGHGVITNQATFFPNTQGGVQLQANLNDQFGAALQLLVASQDLTGEGDYSVRADYAYLHYQANKNWEGRLGRIRLPAFMYSDTQHIGYDYPWVFLPNEVYRIMPFYNVNGINIAWTQRFTNHWNVKAQIYYGNNQSQFANSWRRGKISAGNTSVIPNQASVMHFHEDNLSGGEINFNWHKAKDNNLNLRASFIYTDWYATNVAHTIGQQNDVNNDITQEISIPRQYAYFYSAGVQWDWRNLSMSSEFAHRETDPKAKDGYAVLTSLSGMYGMAGVHIKKFFPYLTYGYITTTNANKLAPSGSQFVAQQPERQSSYTIGLSYTINAHVKAKAAEILIQPFNQNGVETAGLYHFVPAGNFEWISSGELDAIF